jgi:hypothetical protein
MSITLFGTCRINNVIGNNNINNKTNFTQSTKEILQLIQFLTGEKKIEAPLNKLCFRTGLLQNKPIFYSEELRNTFIKSKLVIVEICSAKNWVYNNHYLHHMCVDKRYPSCKKNTPLQVLDNYKCIKQTPREIANDILKIKQLIHPRKMIIVTHYNCKIDGNYIPPRNQLILLLNSIAKSHNINIVNPSQVLKDYAQELVLKEDLAHYTDFGISKIAEYLNNYIRNFT